MWNVQLTCEMMSRKIQLVDVTVCLMVFGVHRNILFIIKLRVHVLIDQVVL